MTVTQFYGRVFIWTAILSLTLRSKSEIVKWPLARLDRGDEAVALSHFGFLAGGSMHFEGAIQSYPKTKWRDNDDVEYGQLQQVDRMATSEQEQSLDQGFALTTPVNDTKLGHILYLVTCPRNTWERDTDTIAFTPPIPNGCFYSGRIDQASRAMTLSFWNTTRQSSWDASFVIPSDGNYVIQLIKCAESPMALSITLTLMNPGGHHLSSDYIPIPYVSLAAFGVCLLINAAWLYNWFRAGKRFIPLHRLITVAMATNAFWSAFSAIYWLRYSYSGYYSTSFDFLRVLLYAWCELAFIGSLLMLSKGWCISRSKLMSIEIRTILGTCIFNVLSRMFYFVSGGSSVLIVLTIQSVSIAYMLWNIAHNATVLSGYIQTLYDDEQVMLLPFYMKKLGIIKSAWRFTLLYTVMTFGAYALEMFDIHHMHYLSVGVNHGIMLVSFMWLGYTFRLYPNVLDGDEEEEENGDVATDA